MLLSNFNWEISLGLREIQDHRSNRQETGFTHFANLHILPNASHWVLLTLTSCPEDTTVAHSEEFPSDINKNYHKQTLLIGCICSTSLRVPYHIYPDVFRARPRLSTPHCLYYILSKSSQPQNMFQLTKVNFRSIFTHAHTQRASLTSLYVQKALCAPGRFSWKLYFRWAELCPSHSQPVICM